MKAAQRVSPKTASSAAGIPGLTRTSVSHLAATGHWAAVKQCRDFEHPQTSDAFHQQTLCWSVILSSWQTLTLMSPFSSVHYPASDKFSLSVLINTMSSKLFLCFISRVAGHRVENATAVVSREQR